ncbi:hypothetical protein MON38_13195 [Hymenobacter sp. DH14]|uniref:Uncharacterized protein n=1 Tax=Hymenobacter cyanobacteriorum TaxID=2926463 RepID=A0A9X1VLL1_9BACT|nr:hypothetical protein [Hymenobacter cyanobacteriorum]MCI1188381.1 hypothetical protein [Hymenobacter cyanobacteriorum]
MPSTTEVSASQKSAYQRPYKTRSQRREMARRKHDENADHKFLIRVAIVAGVLLLVAVGAAIKSWSDREAQAPAPVESLQ